MFVVCAMSDEAGEEAVFKRPSGRGSFRKRRAADEPSTDAAPALDPESSASLLAMRALQRGRQRARGVALEAKGELDLEDQLGADVEEAPGDVAAVLTNTFTQQTEGGDVDPNMLRYIEEAMGTGGAAGDGPSAADAFDDEDAELYKTPEFLLAASRKSAIADEARDREDAQRWLAGIEEVQLSTEEKLLNVEQTERAKSKMLDRLASKMKRSHDRGPGDRGPGERGEHNALPGNFTSNFHMHRKSARAFRARASPARPTRARPRFARRHRCRTPTRHRPACARWRRFCHGATAQRAQAALRPATRAGRPVLTDVIERIETITELLERAIGRCS